METIYLTSAAKAIHLPPMTLNEVAIVGRSNCGKSTLLNSLLQRRSLARTSRTPGQTKMINFFQRGQTHIIADLPGYGFHQAAYKDARDWQDLVWSYLRRSSITRILFLLDIRRTMTAEDIELAYHLSRQLPLNIALTKSDKVNRMQADRAKSHIKTVLAEAKIECRSIHVISSLKKQGIADLQADLFGANETEITDSSRTVN